MCRFCIRVVAIVILLLSLAAVAEAEVYVNMLWDEDFGGFRIKSLMLEGEGVTFDRDYQNAYGSLMHLDPGPPFYIAASIIATSIVDDSGEVVAFGSVTFRSGGFDPLNPFNVYVTPSDDTEGRILVDGPLTFDGSWLDPIKITGGFDIQAGHPGGTKPLESGQHSMVWRNTNFSNPYFHENTWNPYPIQLHGGNITIQDCQFEGFNEFGHIIEYYPTSYATSAPIWDLIIDNCRFENDSVSLRPIALQNLRRLELRNNHFTNVQFSEYNMSGLVMIDECGIGALVNNTAGSNDQNVIRVANSWVSDSATIKSDPSLPVVSTTIDIPRDSVLVIDSGSVVKFYSTGGLAVEGRLRVDGAVLTSWNDDAYGGDSDLDPDPDYISPWYAGQPNTVGGISVDTSGYANISRSRIRYPQGALYAQGPVSVYGTRIEYPTGFGIWMKSYGNEHYLIRSTSVSHNEHSGYASHYAIMFDNAQGGRQRLWLDSVTVYDGDEDGVVIRANSGQPNEVRITNCRFVSNEGNGLVVEMWPSLDSVEIDNCSFIANGQAGLYCSDSQGDSTRIIVANSLFAGNGYSWTPRMGANVHAGIPLFVNNTFAYNNELGLNLYEVMRDSARVINNLFYRNGSYGYAMTDPGTSVLSHNAFYGNRDGNQELYYRLPSGLVKTVEEVQAEGGDFATNLHVDPQMSPEVVGAITSVSFDSARFLSVMTGVAGQFGGKVLRGLAFSPDTSDATWYWVAMNTADSLYIVGDVTDIASVGDTFRVFDYHLQDVSSLVEAGNSAEARGEHDIDGDDRMIDADQNGSILVDIGADEYDPSGGHTSPIRATAPTAGAFFIAGDSCEIKWQADGIDSVRILFLSDPNLQQMLWDTLSAGRAAGDGSFKCELPFELSNHCVVRIEDAANAATYDVSDQFTVKFYALTCLDEHNNIARYFVEDNSWVFGNVPDKMWPAAWYNQFDYKTDIDTVTGKPYPPCFTDSLKYNAKPKDFPDWQLWVRAFGVGGCYINTPTGLAYRTTVLAKWADKKGEWRGSCLGFGVSSALGFLDSAAFRSSYPEVDAYNQLHNLALDDGHRLVVNELLLHQFGRPHTTYRSSHIHDTPRAVLAQLKRMLGDNYTYGQVMGIGNRLKGGHALNPYRMERQPGDSGQYRVYVYDSNYPDTTGTYTEWYVVLDSAANTWFYSDEPTWNDQNGYCYLLDSVALYLTDPWLKGTGSKPPVLSTFPEAGSMELYAPGANDVTIIDSSGDTTALHNGVVTNNISGAEPLIPMTGHPSPPQGYSLPDGPYTVWVGSDSSTTMAASVWRDSSLYRYSRVGVDPSQLDRLTVDSGLSVYNTDSSGKPCEFLYLQSADGQERQYIFSGLAMDGGDRFEIYAPDDSTVSFVNGSGNNTVTIELWLVSDEAATVVVAEDALLPISRRSTVIPDWSDPTLATVRLARDFDGDDIQEDTVLLDVVTAVEDEHGDAGLPKTYELAQNYPNPFNSSTVIEYSLPERSRVSVDIVNVLGQTVCHLVDDEQPAGRYRVVWDGTDGRGKVVATGVYFYRLRAGDFVESKKMMLLK